MRAVVQRVSRAKVSVDEKVVGEIGPGFLVLLGITHSDTKSDADYLAQKISALRVFEDAAGKMNLSLKDKNGELLVVSQFTLYGDVKRGLRPSWSDAAPPEVAEPLYEYFVEASRKLVAKVETGVFRAMMQVELVNNGPVTLLLESQR